MSFVSQIHHIYGSERGARHPCLSCLPSVILYLRPPDGGADQFLTCHLSRSTPFSVPILALLTERLLSQVLAPTSPLLSLTLNPYSPSSYIVSRAKEAFGLATVASERFMGHNG